MAGVFSMKMKIFYLAMLLAILGPAVDGRATDGPPAEVDARMARLFPRPAALEPQIAFWHAIFTEYSAHQVVLHDAVRLDKVYKVLGPHAPNLTANEVNLIHRLWLRFNESVSPLELHHHDVVHFSLEEVQKELDEGKEEELINRLRAHIESNLRKRQPPS